VLVRETVAGEADTADNALVDSASTAPEVSTSSFVNIRDVAVTNVVSSPDTVIGGDTVYIKITVRNNPLGYQRESFRVMTYANETQVGETTGSLAPGESQVYTIPWITTLRMTQAGTYMIQGRVPPLSVAEGPFLKSAGTTSWLQPKIDNDKGTVSASAMLLPMIYPGGAVGNGTLATIFFEVIAEGKTPLHFYYTALRGYNGTPYPISHTAVDGIFTILGDVNGDGDVDTPDLLDLSKAYGSGLSKLNWNLNCDFNRDNKVDASDLFDLSKNYGKSYP